MQICSYVVKHDYGFAPNPYWGYCTLATCTPNHQRARLAKGDWIIGNTSDQRVVYAMRISEILDLHSYYRDPRFQLKKPRRSGTWMEQCGDNIYFRGRGGKWQQRKNTMFHADQKAQEQDIKGDRVFISDHFFYFGENAIVIPIHLKPLLRIGRGIKRNHPQRLVAEFVSWLENSHIPGIHGKPRDLEEWADSVALSCSHP